MVRVDWRSLHQNSSIKNSIRSQAEGRREDRVFYGGILGVGAILHARMRKKFELFIPILILIIGLLLVVGIPAIIHSAKLANIVLLIMFLIYNVVISRLLKRTERLKIIWAPRKIWHLLPGFLIGAVPIGVAYARLSASGELPEFKGFTISFAMLTLVTVSWEELWFRGMSLEVGAEKYTKFGTIVIFAAIFALVHALNPKINMLADGAELFIAGYALGACYFVFNSIWAPIGMHLANNSIQALYGQSNEPQTFAYLGPLILIAVIFSVVLWGAKRPIR